MGDGPDPRLTRIARDGLAAIGGSPAAHGDEQAIALVRVAPAPAPFAGAPAGRPGVARYGLGEMQAADFLLMEAKAFAVASGLAADMPGHVGHVGYVEQVRLTRRRPHDRLTSVAADALRAVKASGGFRDGDQAIIIVRSPLGRGRWQCGIATEVPDPAAAVSFLLGEATRITRERQDREHPAVAVLFRPHPN